MPPEEFQYGQTVPDNFEAESQFILRLPSLPAASLRAAVKSGVLNLKDRLSIQLDADIRNGVVRFDGWTLPSKIVDLPTIIDCHKTLDNKNFHKSADISQMMICKEEADEVKEEPEEAQKKTKDGRDKRYIYPHGVTKPLKNVWKKRFRKTLRKKSVDFPEIESEVKRLLRFDNEAVSVRYEIVDIEEDNKTTSKDRAGRSGAMNSEYDVGDLFGDVVSSSDEDDSEDNSRSVGFKDYLKDDVDGGQSQQGYSSFSQILQQQQQQPSTSTASAAMMNEESESQMENEGMAAASNLELGNINESLRRKAEELESEIANIETQKLSQQMELDGIENMALKQRFQAIIDDLNEQKDAKMRELEDLKCLI